MNLSSVIRLGIAIGLSALNASAWALSLGPAMFKVQHVAPGQVLDVRKSSGVVFVIKNTSDSEGAYTLKCRKPIDGGLVDWEQGYEQIPDASWCSLDKEEFVVPANSQSEIGLLINVPDKPENYNCKWMLAVVLAPKGSKGIGVGLAVAARVQIETLPSDDNASGNAASIATAPSVIDISGVPGGEYKKAAIVRNNTTSELKCSTEKLTQVYPTEEFKYARYPTGGYTALVKDSWLASTADPFALKPGEQKELAFAAKIPANAKPDDKCEELVFITAPAPEARESVPPVRPFRTFIRIRYTVVAEGADKQAQPAVKNEK